MEPDHPIIIGRIAGIFLCGLPAVRELFQYINDPRFVTRSSIPETCNSPPLTSITQESDQDGTTYMAPVGDNLH